MNRNYPSPSPFRLYEVWADRRNTCEEVAAAIDVVSELSGRPMDHVWDSPDDTEIDHVKMCLNEWARLGDIEADTYHWGNEHIDVVAS